MEIRSTLALLMLLTIATGCLKDEDTRLVEMTRRHEMRQAEQNVRAAELQREVAAMQQAVQSERISINRERDKLEHERREIASSRRFDSLIATAITSVSLILACLLPLGLIWLLLAKPQEADGERFMVDLMLDDMVAETPLLFDRENDSQPRRLTDGKHFPEEPSPTKKEQHVTCGHDRNRDPRSGRAAAILSKARTRRAGPPNCKAVQQRSDGILC